jgi:hypothetical protein
MIDEAFDTDFEDRLRDTLDEMIPKLVAGALVESDDASSSPVRIITARHTSPVRASRRLMVALTAVAATIVGLIVITGRDTGHVTPGEDVRGVEAPPPWYELIRPSLPERFPYAALTLATEQQLWFVAIDPIEGKTLEIELGYGEYSTQTTTTLDTTGAWVETGNGWSVQMPGGMFVSVACDVGVGGRDYAGPVNYCDQDAGVTAFTKDDIRAVVNALATSLTLSIFGQNIGAPSGDSIDTKAATNLISAAVPGQTISASDLGHGADHIYNVGGPISSPSDTVPPPDVASQPVDTSIRILHGIYPPPPMTGVSQGTMYPGAAVVWMFGEGGVDVRVSTTNPTSTSVARLEQLAGDLLKLDAASTDVAPEATTTSIIGTLEDSATTSTISECDHSSPPPTVVVVNASHDANTASWWTEELAANVPSVHFADAVNGVTHESASRVFALDGYDCDASLVAAFTAVTGIETASPEQLQALTASALPLTTSIVVVIGDDNMSNFTTGVTTTTTEHS